MITFKLILYLKNESVDDFLDLQINHGHLRCFPWLIAHHLSFFKYPNFNLLNMLLKHRRGFNAGLGSKVRKLYFSDVKIIFKDFGMKLHYCEDFKPTENIRKTEKAKSCNEVIHKVSDIIEDFEFADSFSSDIDNFKPNVMKMEDLPVVLNNRQEKKTGFGELLDLLKNGGGKKRLIRDEESLMESYINLCEEIEEIEEKINEKNEILNGIEKPKFQESINVFTEALKDPLEHNIILEYVIGLLKEPTSDSLEAFENYKTAYFKFAQSQTNPNFRRLQLAKDNLFNKKHFYFKEELDIVLLDEQIKELRRIVSNNPNRESLKNELKFKLAEKTNKIKFITDVETFKNLFHIKLFDSVYYKSKKHVLFNSFIGIDLDFEMDDRVRELLIQFLQSFKGRFIKKKLSSEDLDLLEIMNEIKLANEIGETEIAVELRAKLLKESKIRGIYLSKESLCFTEEENDRTEQLLEILISKEKFYHQSVRKWKSKRATRDYVEHNRMLAKRFGVDPGLDEDKWRARVFQAIERSECEEKISKYEFFVKEFCKYFGVEAVNSIIGGETEIENSQDNFPFLNEYEKSMLKVREEYIKENPITSKNDEFMNVLKAGMAIIIDANETPFLNTPNFVFGKTYGDAVRGKQKDIRALSFTEKQKYKTQTETLIEDVKMLKNKKDAKEIEMEMVVNMFEINEEIKSKHINKKDWQIVHKKPINIKGRRKIENEYNLNRFDKNIQGELVKDRIGELYEKSDLKNNRYFAISCHEDVDEAAENCVEFFKQKSSTPFLFKDFSKYRKFDEEKRLFKKENEEVEMKHVMSTFSRLYNTNSNKKYDIRGACNFIKLMSAMAILNMKPTHKDYIIFGLKKCQANYALKQFKQVVINLLKAVDKQIP